MVDPIIWYKGRNTCKHCFDLTKPFFVNEAKKAGGHKANNDGQEVKKKPDPRLPSYMYFCEFCKSSEKHTNYGNYSACTICNIEGTNK